MLNVKTKLSIDNLTYNTQQIKLNLTHHLDKDVDIVWIESRLRKLK